MLTTATWRIDPLHILMRRELAAVLADLVGQADRTASVRSVKHESCFGEIDRRRQNATSGLRRSDIHEEASVKIITANRDCAHFLAFRRGGAGCKSLGARAAQYCP